MSIKPPIVAVIGRPNVGKSTLFNRIIGQNKAVVEDIPGVTRDRNYALVEKFEFPFMLVDTAGFESSPGDEFERDIVAQTIAAANQADLVIAIFDGKAGLQLGDEEVVDLLRRSDKPALFVANKCDAPEHAARIADFFTLGVDEVVDVSALNGRGVRQLIGKALSMIPGRERYIASAKDREIRIDQAIAEAKVVFEEEDLPEEDDSEDLESEWIDDAPLEEEDSPQPSFAPVYLPGESQGTEKDYDASYRNRLKGQRDYYSDREDEESSADWKEEIGEDGEVSLWEDEKAPELIKLAIIGRPNVGKSTLLNTLTGEARAITSNIAGTTRDSIDIEIKREGQRYLLVDTAGMRKKSKLVDSQIEYYSSLRSLRALSECDVAILLIDAIEGATEQDVRIAGLAHDQGKGLVIVVNKWDAVEKNHLTVEKVKKEVRSAFKFAAYAPLIFASALKGRRCPRIIETAKEVALWRRRRINTGSLNRILARAIRRQSPPLHRGRPVKLYFATQVETSPPSFALFLNYPRSMHFSYVRYLKNSIRDNLEFLGSDIKFILRAKRRDQAKS